MAPTNTDQTVYTQRQHTTRDDWTPQRVKSARQRAELGDLMLAADLCEYLMTDDRASGVLSTRVRGLLKSPISFEDAQSDETTPVTEALESDFWDAYPETDLQQLTNWGLMLGVGLGQHQWEFNPDGRLIPRLQVWHPRWLRFDHHSRTWRLHTEQGDIPILPGDHPDSDGTWILYTPHGSHSPWRHGLYRSVAPWWMLKRYAIMDWGSYSEAHGHPLRKGTTPEGAHKKEREELAQDLEQISGVTGIGLPPGFDVELVEATARTWETFQAQINKADTGIAIAITGNNLTTEVGSGSLAAAKVHEVIRHDLIESDEQTLSTTLRAQGLTWWALYNFGLERVEAPWVRWDTTPPEEPPQIEAHHITAGAVSINDIRRSLGLPALDDEKYDKLLPPGAGTAGVGAALSGTREGDALRRLAEEGVHVHTTQAEPKRDARQSLANGNASAPPGMVSGQAYVDRLLRRGAPVEAVKDRAQQLLRVIDEANSFDDILDALPGVVEDIDDAGPMIEGLIMASAAGAASEIDDHPEEE